MAKNKAARSDEMEASLPVIPELVAGM